MLTPSLDFTIHSTNFVELVVVTHDGHRFTAHFGGDVWRGPGRKVVYDRDGQWSGEGVWTGTATTDCGADLPEQVYAALDAGGKYGDLKVAKVDYKQIPFGHGGLKTMRDMKG